MEWNVLVYNWNNKCLEPYNVLRLHEQDIKAIYNQSNGDRERFDTILDREMKYFYTFKGEYDIFISSWFHSELENVDIYMQLRINWKRFSDYCWDAANELYAPLDQRV